MKVITLTQPWAALILAGEKHIETRGWQAKYRGPLLIHAAKGWPREAQALCHTEPFERVLWRNHLGTTALNMQRGKIIAKCNLKNIIGTESFYNKFGTYGGSRGEFEQDFGDYSAERYAWILTDIEPIKPMIPARGALSLWEYPIEDMLL